MPIQPVTGRSNIENMIRAFTASWTETGREIVNLAVSGDLVVAVRLDRTKAGAKSVDLHCAGVFDMKDGKIRALRLLRQRNLRVGPGVNYIAARHGGVGTGSGAS